MEFSNDPNEASCFPSFSRLSQLHKSDRGWNLGEVTYVDRGREMNCLLETPKLKFFAARASFYILWTERGRSLRK